MNASNPGPCGTWRQRGKWLALALVAALACATVVAQQQGAPPQSGGPKRPPGILPIPLPGRAAPADPVNPTPAKRAATDNLPPDVKAALDELGRVRRDRTVYFRAGLALPADTKRDGEPPAAAFWLVAELDGTVARKTIVPEDIAVSAVVTDVANATVATATGTISATAPTCVLRFPPVAAPSGDYMFALTVKSPARTAVTDELHVFVPPDEERRVASPLLLRSGPFSTPQFQSTADPRFRKAERLRADAPLAQAPDAVSARLLDRFGRPLRVPVTASLRVEQGISIASAEVVLAPLAPGDYLVEVAARFGTRDERGLVAVRIVP